MIRLDEAEQPDFVEVLEPANSYCRLENIWDCAGDMALELMICKISNTDVSDSDKRIMLQIWKHGRINTKYYTEESLIKIFSRLKDWDISVKYKEKEGEYMDKERFYVECPEFGRDFDLHSERARRDYAHPVDSGIIKFLDNPAVNSVFKQLVEMMSDSTHGQVVASGVVINEKNYPELNKLVEECVAELRIKRPYVIISSAISGLNAMAFGSDEDPYVALSPLLVKTLNPVQLKFVIGHECGHIAMGHMIYHTVISIAAMFASAVPIIGPAVNTVGALPLMAWSRRSEISADRAGLLCCGDCEAAQRTMLQLMMPFMDASRIDLDDYVNNADNYLKKGVIRKLNEFNDAHPIMPKRIHALSEFTSSAKYYKLTGREIPMGAISDSELENRVENIIRIL